MQCALSFQADAWCMAKCFLSICLIALQLITVIHFHAAYILHKQSTCCKISLAVLSTYLACLTNYGQRQDLHYMVASYILGKNYAAVASLLIKRKYKINKIQWQ